MSHPETRIYIAPPPEAQMTAALFDLAGALSMLLAVLILWAFGFRQKLD